MKITPCCNDAYLLEVIFSDKSIGLIYIRFLNINMILIALLGKCCMTRNASFTSVPSLCNRDHGFLHQFEHLLSRLESSIAAYYTQKCLIMH